VGYLAPCHRIPKQELLMAIAPPLILSLIGIFLFVVGVIKLGGLMLWPTLVSLALLVIVIQQERRKALRMAAPSEGMGSIIALVVKIIAVQIVFCGWTAWLIWSHCPQGIC
jgi:hypothetical protein